MKSKSKHWDRELTRKTRDLFAGNISEQEYSLNSGGTILSKGRLKKVFNEMKRISKNMLLIETESKIKSKASHIFYHNYDILFGNNLFSKKKLNALGDTLFRIIND